MPNSNGNNRYVAFYRLQGWDSPIEYECNDLVELLNYCNRCLTTAKVSWFILDRNTATVAATHTVD